MSRLRMVSARFTALAACCCKAVCVCWMACKSAGKFIHENEGGCVCCTKLFQNLISLLAQFYHVCSKLIDRFMNRVERFYDKVFTWVLRFGPRILLAVVILVVGLWLIRLFKKWLGNLLEHRNLAPS